MAILKLKRGGIEIPPGVLGMEHLGKLKRGLIVTSKGFQNRIMTMQAFYNVKVTRTMYAARMRGIALLTKLGHTVVLDIAEGEDISARCQGTFKLFDYQVPIFNYLVDVALSDTAEKLGMSSATLDLQPGKGKTFLAMSIMEWFGRKTLFIVPGKDLVKQTVDTLKAMYPQLRIGIYTGTVKTDGDVVVMTVQSATNSDEYEFKTAGRTVKMTSDAYFDRFGFTVFDEMHTYCTKERAMVFARCQSRFTLGISGTCNHRPDKMDPIAHYWIGTPISGAKLMAGVLAVQAASMAPQKPWKFQSTCLKYNGPAEFTQSLTSTVGTVSAPMMVTQFSKDPYRSQLLVNTIHRLVKEDERNQIFVMLDRTELVKLACDYLRTAIPTGMLIAPELQGASMVTGKVKEKERGVARQSRIVVGTYACIGTGISWDEFNCLVCWHPRKTKWEQFLNRIFREGGDRDLPRQAFFLQDNATSLKNQFYGFRKVCIVEREVTPAIAVWDYSDIKINNDVKKIAEDFAKWDDEHHKKEKEEEKPIEKVEEKVEEESDHEFDSTDEDGVLDF